MQRKIINSKTIVSFAYDTKANVLEVEFKDGSVYQYSEISVELFLAVAVVNNYFDEDYFMKNVQGKYPRVLVSRSNL